MSLVSLIGFLQANYNGRVIWTHCCQVRKHIIVGLIDNEGC